MCTSINYHRFTREICKSQRNSCTFKISYRPCYHYAMITLNNNRPTQIFLPVMTVTLFLHPVSEVLSFYISVRKSKDCR